MGITATVTTRAFEDTAGLPDKERKEVLEQVAKRSSFNLEIKSNILNLILAIDKGKFFVA